jgi:hypothetical protein
MKNKFCERCHNNMYLRQGDDGGAGVHCHCKCCATTTEAVLDSSEAACVIDNNYREDLHKQYMTKYIEEDPTLPRTDAIPCKNKACTRKENEKESVIYVKYDKDNMKFQYSCCHCKTFWRTK